MFSQYIASGPKGDSANEILPGLWLGNINAATDTAWLSEKGIQCVFNCTKELPFTPSIPRQYRVPVDDNLQPSEIRNLELWSFEIVQKMSLEYRTGQPMLIHCAAGRQRSAACVAMFLIAQRNINPLAAIQYIRSKRPEAFFPSANFMPAIEGFYRVLQKKTNY
jgi:dual specificity phosphatase 12